MKLYNKQETVTLINKFSSQNIPFIFIISYKCDGNYVLPLNEVNSDECLFNFRGFTNLTAAGASNGNCHLKDCSAVDTNNVISRLRPENDCEKSGNQYNCMKKDSLVWDYKLPPYSDYEKSFNIVKNNILKGNSFLTNLTCKIPLNTNLSLKDIFHSSDALYKLWVKNQFVCFSPEIFIRIENGIIKSYPMKGTIDANILNAQSVLINDVKESAEHATIVDLIRNDLSQISSNVKVNSYRYIDKLVTNKGAILQTSSEITGSLPAGFSNYLGDIIFSLLPAGSITGAPKLKTMDIISQSEDFERGFYTGVMGIWNNKSLDSAVMIRFIENDNGKYYFKAGGGITSKSECINEYDEIRQKTYVPIY